MGDDPNRGRDDAGTRSDERARLPSFLSLSKTGTLDLALVSLETVGGAGDGAAGASEEGGASEVGRRPPDVLVLLDDVVPEIGILLSTAGAAPAS